MKHISTIVLFLSFACTIQAQTITRDWISSVTNQVVSLAAAIDETNPLTPGDAGSGVTWDFSMVTPDDTLPPIGFEYVDPAQTTFASEFPDANIALTPTADTLEDVFTSYFSLTDDALSLLGFGTQIAEGSSLSLYSDPQVIMQFPFSFGDSYSDPWERTTTAEALGMTFTINNSGVDEVTYDGTGTLITPAGTFDNALRIKTISSQSDTSEIAGSVSVTTIENESYQWYQQNFAGLANYSRTVSTTELIIPGVPPTVQGPFESVSFTWSDSEIVTNSNDFVEPSALQIQLLNSNPVVEDVMQMELEVERSNDLKLAVYNAAGVLSYRNTFKVFSGRQTLNIDVPGNLVNGHYNLVFATKEGNYRTVMPVLLMR